MLECFHCELLGQADPELLNSPQRGTLENGSNVFFLLLLHITLYSFTVPETILH